MRSVLFLVSSIVVVVGCRGDDAQPGEVGGPCLEGEVCPEPLTCASSICVDLSDVGTATGGADEAGDSRGGGEAGQTDSTSGGGGGEDAADDTAGSATGAAEVHCYGDGDGCLCGHNPDYGPPGGPCSTSTVASPAVCCAAEGWPQWGTCSCWHLSCRVLSPDTCYCGLGSVDPEDEAVSTCSVTDGVCCLDVDANNCSCHEGLSQCVFDDDVEVSSCSVQDILGCGDATSVEACA
jgi:hypothetical protein